MLLHRPAGVSSRAIRVSETNGRTRPRRLCFTDEGRCIGCKQCALHAPNTFAMEPFYNVARVETQWGDDEEEVEVAVACCPTDCIYTVPRDDLARGRGEK